VVDRAAWAVVQAVVAALVEMEHQVWVMCQQQTRHRVTMAVQVLEIHYMLVAVGVLVLLVTLRLEQLLVMVAVEQHPRLQDQASPVLVVVAAHPLVVALEALVALVAVVKALWAMLAQQLRVA
jgi:hypothetical protein